MSERPFMQLYVSDYLGDTRHLSCEQHGAYLLLLMTMWNADGALPDDDKKLARCIGVSLKKWQAIKPDVVEFFVVADGFWTHNRLTKERQKGDRKGELRAAAGAIGGAAKALKSRSRQVAIATNQGKHLPEPYRKEAGAIALDPTESPASMMTIDRSRDGEDLVWAECERLNGGKKAPSGGWTWSWPAAIVTQARANVAAAKAAA